MTSEFTVAVHGLVYLNHKGCYVNSEQMADNICTNPARVRKVMAKLKKAGLVETKEGLEGGYYFPKAPETVTLADVARALDVAFVSTSWHSGDSAKDCLIACGMAAILDDIYAALDQTCKDHLATITIATLNQRIFPAAQEESACSP